MNGLSLAALLGAANWWIGSGFSDADSDEAVPAGAQSAEAADAELDGDRHLDDRPYYPDLPGLPFNI